MSSSTSSPSRTDLSAQLRELTESTTLLRSRGAYGRKLPQSTINALAAIQPIDIHHYDEATGVMTIQQLHDPTAICEDNVRQYNSGNDGYTPSRELRKVASIPLGEVTKLYAKGINVLKPAHWPQVAAMLDSNEWLKWRTAPGKISKRPLREYLQVRRRDRPKPRVVR